MSSDKFCVDCKYYENLGNEYPSYIRKRCNKKLFEGKNLVTGEDLFKIMGACYDQRHSDKKEDCGPEGKYFEPKVEWKLEDLFRENK